MYSRSYSPQAYLSGEPTGEYKVWQRPANVLTIVVGFVLGAGIILDGLLRIADIGLGFLAFLASGLLFIGGALYLAINAYMERGLQVKLYQDGITDTRAGKTTTVRWDEVNQIYMAVTKHHRYGRVSTTHVYRLKLASGKTITYRDSVAGVEQLGIQLEQGVARYWLPKAVESVKSGIPMSFGKLTASRDGVTDGKTTVLWGDVDKVFLNSGVINVKPKGATLATSWPRQKVSKTPNVLVFLELTQAMTGKGLGAG